MCVPMTLWSMSRLQEKQKLSERQIEELSGRVSALELEKQELQRALKQARHSGQVITIILLLLNSTSGLVYIILPMLLIMTGERYPTH